MAHGHTHEHSHHATTRNRLLLAIALLIAFSLIEGISGWKANSMALLSDAGHTLTDGLSLLLAAIANWIATKPPSKKHSYGFARAEVLGAWINSLLMVLIAIFIGIEALARLRNPQPVLSPVVIIVAILGILLNASLAWILSHTEQTLNMRAAILHIIGDFLGSISALIAGIIIYFTGWMPIDPLLSLFIALLILISSVRLLKETLAVLMEGVPLHLDFHEIGNAMTRIEKVKHIHDLHIWTLSSGRIMLTAHVDLLDMADWEFVFPRLRKLLQDKFEITHITLQPEPFSRHLERSKRTG